MQMNWAAMYLQIYKYNLCHFQTAVHLVFNSTETSEHLNNKAIITTGGEASTSYVIFPY